MAQQFCVAFSQACPQRRMPSSASPSSSNYRGFPRVSAPIPARDPTLDAGGKRVLGAQDAIAQAAGSCCCGTEAELLNSQGYGSWVGIGVGPLAPCVDPDRGNQFVVAHVDIRGPDPPEELPPRPSRTWSPPSTPIAVLLAPPIGPNTTAPSSSPHRWLVYGQQRPPNPHCCKPSKGSRRLGFTAHVDDRQRPMGRGFSPPLHRSPVPMENAASCAASKCSVDGMMTWMFTEAELEFLEDHGRGRLATLGADGAPQVHPVLFIVDAGVPSLDIIGETLREAQKYRNVRRDPRVTLTVDDPALPLAGVDDRAIGRGLRIRGLAEVGQASGWDVIRIRPVRLDVWNLVSVGHRSRFFT